MIFKICEKNNQIIAKNIKKFTIGKYSLVINKWRKSIEYQIRESGKGYTTIRSKEFYAW